MARLRRADLLVGRQLLAAVRRFERTPFLLCRAIPLVCRAGLTAGGLVLRASRAAVPNYRSGRPAEIARGQRCVRAVLGSKQERKRDRRDAAQVLARARLNHARAVDQIVVNVQREPEALADLLDLALCAQATRCDVTRAAAQQVS